MLLYWLLYLAIGFVSGSTEPEDVAVGDRPFQVSLRLHDVVYDENNHFCSGAILDPKWVVTAARCLDNKRSHRIRVVAGTVTLDSKGSWHEVEKTIMNDNYRKQNVANDVGLVKIKDKFEFNDKISAISMPKKSTPAGTTCVVAGWGYLTPKGKLSQKLQAANVTTMSTDECRKTGLKQYQDTRPITDRQICAFKQDGEGICMTDSGAPLIKSNELVGIASFDLPCYDDLPNVYLRVYDYRDWITRHMK